MMRGTDEASGPLFSYIDLERRIPARHPLRTIRQIVNGALASLDCKFDRLYADFGPLDRASRVNPGQPYLDHALGRPRVAVD